MDQRKNDGDGSGDKDDESATNQVDARVAALAGQLRQALDDKLREQPSRSSDGAAAVELSEQQLSGMLQRAVNGGVSGQLPPGDDISESELAALPFPPFAGAGLKRFRRVPRWPRPGAHTLWVEGQGELAAVVAHYLALVHASDPSAKAERKGNRVQIKSEQASADIDISLYEDGTTVSVQVMYGGW